MVKDIKIGDLIKWHPVAGNKAKEHIGYITKIKGDFIRVNFFDNKVIFGQETPYDITLWTTERGTSWFMIS